MSKDISRLDQEWSETERTRIQACLDKVLSSSIFANAERQQRFLRYVVTHTLARNAERLKGYTIGLEVFDRESTFDPTMDAIVRVEAARLRAKLREYYDIKGRADPIRFEMPKGGYAVCIACSEQDSPQGPSAKQETSVVPAATQVPKVGADVIASARVRPIEDKPSLAVLPFTNMSADPKQEYFADGITDNLITDLSRLSGLFVISRHSSFVYKEVSKRAEEIGRELGVKYLLEGSVQRSGDRVRISAQLIDTVSGVHIWAERYDRDLKVIFAVQDDVTRRIVAALQVKLVGAEAERLGHEGTTSIEAHDFLMRGLARLWAFTQESSEEARALFAKAVELDPGYAAAHAWLARALVFRWIMLWDPNPETLERAFEHARAAVELDPQMPLGYSILGWVQLWRGQSEPSIAAGWRAVTMDPNNADAHLFLSFALVAAGRGEEALHYIDKGIRLNPHPSAVSQLVLGLCYFVLEEYDKAIAAFKRGIGISDAFIPNHYWLCMAYTQVNLEEEARIAREKVLKLTGGRTPALQNFWLDEDLRLRTQGLQQLAGLE